MVTSKWPPLPVTVCATALAASSLARRIASSRTGHGARTRRVKSRACAICSVRPGKTRRLKRAISTAAPSWPEASLEDRPASDFRALAQAAGVRPRCSSRGPLEGLFQPDCKHTRQAIAEVRRRRQEALGNLWAGKQQHRATPGQQHDVAVERSDEFWQPMIQGNKSDPRIGGRCEYLFQLVESHVDRSQNVKRDSDLNLYLCRDVVLTRLHGRGIADEQIQRRAVWPDGGEPPD